VIEHLGNEALVAEARRKSAELGFMPYIGPAGLDHLVHPD
jgi:hypothetical protein